MLILALFLSHPSSNFKKKLIAGLNLPTRKHTYGAQVYRNNINIASRLPEKSRGRRLWPYMN